MQQAMVASGAAKSVEVTNVPGSGGSVGLIQFVNEAKGDGARLMISGFVMVGSLILNKTPVTLEDVTPIARLTADTQAIAVPTNSPIKDARHLASLLRADPSKVLWGGGSIGGADYTTAALLAATVGGDPAKLNWTSYAGGAKEVAALLDGSVMIGLSGYGTFDAEIKAGRMRLIGITAPTRRPGFDGPTLKEQGIDLVLENWRSVVAAPGISAAQKKALVDAIDRMVKSSAWAEILREKRWDDAYLGGDAFAAFLKAEQVRVGGVLKSVGLAK
jgi:putative tricarboxylic transport membrane protein